MKSPKVTHLQIFQLQLPEPDEEPCFPLHRVNVGYSKRAIKAQCQLTTNSMMTGIGGSKEVGRSVAKRYVNK
jgi:hypothetical protein